MRDLAAQFPDAKGTTTRKGSLNRINRAMKGLGDNTQFLYIIVAREDGTFIPIIILAPHHINVARFLVDHGICVINA